MDSIDDFINKNLQVYSIYKHFNKEWLLLPEFRDWLREIPDEPDKFYCFYCERKYCGNKAEIKKHKNSMKHRKLEEMKLTGKTKETIELEKLSSTEYQKRFRYIWMEEVNFREWLLPVPNEPEKFECCFCDAKYIGGKSEISKHHKSSKHQKMIELVESNSELKEQYKVYVSKCRSELKINEFVEDHNRTDAGNFKFRFRDEFLLDPELKDWLKKVEDLEKFGCKVCGQEYSGGKWEMKKHARSSKHKKNSEELSLTDDDLNPDPDHDDFVFENDPDEYASLCPKPDEIIEEQEEVILEAKGFNDQWLNVREFADWLQKIPADLSKFGCNFCKGVYFCADKNDVTDHLKSPEHMEIEVQLCYKNNEILEMCKNLWEETGTSYDVLIMTNANGKYLKAHRIVLSSCEFFRNIFQSSIHFEMESVIKIHIPDFSQKIVELFLEFLYTGEVMVTNRNMPEFIALCQQFKINTFDEKIVKNPGESEMVVEDFSGYFQDEENPQNQQILFENQEVFYSHQIPDQQTSEIYLTQIDSQCIIEAGTSASSVLGSPITSYENPEPPDIPAKRQKLSESFSNVDEIRNEFSKFKERLIQAINYYNVMGDSVEAVSEKFSVPVTVLRRNVGLNSITENR